MARIEKTYRGPAVRIVAAVLIAAVAIEMLLLVVRAAHTSWLNAAFCLLLVGGATALGRWRWRWLVDLAIFNLPLWIILPMRLGMPNFSVVEAALLAGVAGAAVPIVRTGRFQWYRTPLTPYLALFALAGILSCALYFTKWFIVFDPVFWRALLKPLGSLLQLEQMSHFYPLRALQVLLEGVVFYHVIIARLRDAADARRLVRISVLSALLVSLFGIFQYFTNWNRIDFEPWGQRVNATFPDVNSLASFLIANLFFVLAFVRKPGTHRPRFFALFALLAIFVCFYMTHSRIAYAAFIVTLPVFVFLSIRAFEWERVVVALHHRRKFIATVFVLLMLTLGFVFLGFDWESHSDLGWTRSTGRVAHALKGRLNIWRSAFYNVARSPWMGRGVGSFYSFLPWGWERIPNLEEWNWNPWFENAHNQYIQVITEMGVVGGGLFLLILGLVLYQGMRSLVIHEDDRTLFAAVLCGLVALLLTCLTGHPLVMIEMNLWFWFVAALLFTPAESESRDYAEYQKRRKGFRTFLLAALLVAVAVKWTDAARHWPPASYGHGLYPMEMVNSEEGRSGFFWLRKRAVFRLHQRRLDLQFSLRNIHGAAKPIHVKIKVNGKVIDRVRLDEPDWRVLSYRLQETAGTMIKLEVISDTVWEDRGRKLTVQIQSVFANAMY